MNKALPEINHATVVFTKHARERLALRRLSEDMVIQLMRKPASTWDIEDGKIKFVGKVMGAKVHAICKPVPEENKWLVITLWVRGEDDKGNFVTGRKSYAKRGFADTLLQRFSFALIVIVVLLIFLASQQR